MKRSDIRKKLLSAQKNEITEYHTYKWLARKMKGEGNREVLTRIADDELKHYRVFRKLTGREVKPQKLKVFYFQLISRMLGLSFGLRLMERGEEVTRQVYTRLKEELPRLADVIMDEQRHEHEIIGLIDDERIQYASSIVLGLNDALVELTGALAGLTFALQDSRVIAMAGFITGVAASMSMGASEYLSSREDDQREGGRSPIKSATYTGASYIITVFILILPYFLVGNVYTALMLMVALSLIIILSYNYYISTAKGVGLWSRFGTMAAISLTVASISFLVGMVARKLFGVEV